MYNPLSPIIRVIAVVDSHGPMPNAQAPSRDAGKRNDIIVTGLPLPFSGEATPSASAWVFPCPYRYTSTRISSQRRGP